MHANSTSASTTAATFVCPFCGLLCDDMPDPGPSSGENLWSQGLQALCPRASGGVAAWAAGAAGTASIDGALVSADAALREAALRLGAARRPVIGGLGGDVQMARAALALGDLLGARVLHRNQFFAQRNIFAMQRRGGMTTTLAEAKNRAQMVVVFGSEVSNAFPRLYHRIFASNPAFTDASQRYLILLGAPRPSRVPADVAIEDIELGGLDAIDAIGALRACVRDAGLSEREGSVIPAALANLAQRMRDCHYGVIIWAAADLPAANGDLLVEQIHQLVVDLNRSTRWAALPLGGNEGDLGANAVATWQTGFALPLEFSREGVAYDPFPDYGDADLLLWVNTLPGVGAPQLPGVAADLPAIVVGTGSTALPARHVVLPAATPAISSSGHLVRTDGVITIFAQKVRATSLPSGAAVLGQLMEAIVGEVRA